MKNKIKIGASSSNSIGGGYQPSYAYQEPKGRDYYGNHTYERYKQSYPYEIPSGRDMYGFPTYG